MRDTLFDTQGALAFCATQGLNLLVKEHQKGITYVVDGEVRAACVYEEDNGANIWMHCAGTKGSRWLTRDFIYWAFHYPFEQLRVSRISLWVEANNLASVRFVEHLGFRREAVLRGAGRAGVDALIYVLFKEDYDVGPLRRKEGQQGEQRPEGRGSRNASSQDRR